MKKQNKTALVTGAGRGLGFEICLQLGRLGYKIILGVRDPSSVDKQMNKLEKQQIECATLKLDMGDISSIELAVDSLKKETSCLDVLVNNAGTFEEDWGTLPSELDFADLKRTFDVNFFGPYRLTQLLVPIIKKSPQGRIVNISSDMGSLEGINDPNSLVYEVMGPAYQASKVSINSITALFAKELRDTNCKVNSASPGWCRTDMGTDSAPLTVEEGAATPVWLATLPQDGPTGKFFSSTRNKGKMEW